MESLLFAAEMNSNFFTSQIFFLCHFRGEGRGFINSHRVRIFFIYPFSRYTHVPAIIIRFWTRVCGCCASTQTINQRLSLSKWEFNSVNWFLILMNINAPFIAHSTPHTIHQVMAWRSRWIYPIQRRKKICTLYIDSCQLTERLQSRRRREVAKR